jgi:hypothetical protein
MCLTSIRWQRQNDKTTNNKTTKQLRHPKTPSSFCLTQTSSRNFLLPTMVLQLSADDFLQLGLQLAGFDPGTTQRTCANTNRRRFNSNFEACPKTCVDIFLHLQTTHIDEARVNKPNPVYMMMAIHWLSTYKTEEQIAGNFKVGEKTVQKWTWFYTQKIQALKGEKVITIMPVPTTTHSYYSNFVLFFLLGCLAV